MMGQNHDGREREREASRRVNMAVSLHYKVRYFITFLLFTVDGLSESCQIPPMKAPVPPDAVWFTTKGQVVIPARLRRQFHIENGTKALVEATPDGILLKPVTSWAIQRGFGLLKRKPNGQSFAEEWAEHKRAERELEDQ